MAFNDTISTLSGTSTFYDWFIKENNEIIAKLNQITVSGITSGDGVLAGLSASSGLVTVSIGGTSGNIRSGLTFSGSVSFIGETTLPNISYKITGLTLSSTSNGFTFGSVVRITSSGYTFAKADSADSAEVIGVLSSMTPAYSVVTLSGKIDGDFTTVAGATLSPGCVYFLDPANSGKITLTEPNTVGQVSKPVIIGLGATSGVVIQYRGNYLDSPGGGSGDTTSRIYAAFEYAFGGTDPRSYGFSAGVFLSYAPDLISGNTFFNQYLVDTGRTAINGWFISGSKNYVYRGNYSFGTEYTDFPWEENYIVGMVESISDVSPNVIYQIVTRGVSTVIPRTITDSGTKSGIWGISGKTFNPSGLTGQLSPFPIKNSLDAYPPTYQVGLVTSESPTNWFVDPRPIANTPNTQYRSTQLPSTLTNGINYAWNGNFKIWQRAIRGVPNEYSTTAPNSTFYFADNWIRRVKGVTGTQSIQGIKLETTTPGQTDIEGNPEKYIALKMGTLATQTTPANCTYTVGHVIENSETFASTPITVSFYAKAELPSYEANVYIARYLNGFLSSKTIMGTVELQTQWTKHVINHTVAGYTYAFPFVQFIDDDYIEIGLDFNPLITKQWQAGLGPAIGARPSIASLAIYRGTYSNPPHIYENPVDQLRKAHKFYYTTYAEQVVDGSTTMRNITDPALSCLIFEYLPNKPYVQIRHPVAMRDNKNGSQSVIPTVTIYSPLDGTQTEMYNVSAGRELRNTAGTIGYNGQVRFVDPGINTVSYVSNAEATQINVDTGAVPFDVIAGHVVVDASYPIIF